MSYCPECSSYVPDTASFCSTCGASVHGNAAGTRAEPAADDEVAERLQEDLAQALAPRYEILGRIGRGGMGSVFLAKEPALRRLVAVKALDPRLSASSVARQRFAREARAAAALSHSNVIRVYGVGEIPERRVPYIVMQYVAGSALQAWQEKHGEVTEIDARRILGQVASALAAAHRRGFVHRDIKPSNILIEEETGNAFVADFGIAAVLAEDVERTEPKLTGSDMLIGTPAYMSPEQVAREVVTPSSDMYSLGIVAFELLTGQLPIPKGPTPAILAAHVLDSPKPLLELQPDASPEIAALVDRCLLKDANVRPTASQVADAMLPSFEAALAWPPPGLQVLQGRARRLAGIALLSGIGALGLAVLLASPPEFVRIDGQWWERFGPHAGSPLGVESGATAVRVPWWWWLAPFPLFVALAGGLVWLFAASTRARATLVKARSLGWRWETLADVLADSDGRSGLLTTGARGCAALESGQRRAMLRARRWRVGAPLVGAVWATIAMGLWAVLVVLGAVPLRGAAPLVSMAFAAMVGIPVVLGVLLWIVAAMRDRRALRSVPTGGRRSGSTAIPVLHASRSDVTKWYETLPGHAHPQPIRRRMPRSLVKSLEVGVALAALSIVASLALVVAGVRVAGRAIESLGRETAELAAALDYLVANDPVGTARQAWARYLPQKEPLDSGDAGDWLRALSSADGVAPYAVSPTALARTDTGYQIGTLIVTAGRELTADTRQLYRMVSEHPRTELMRRLARAQTIDVVAGPLDRPLEAYASIAELPRLDYQHLRDALAANALAAVGAIAANDTTRAATLLGENAAFAEHFLWSPILHDGHWGAGALREFALLPLVAVEEARGDSDQATALRAAADRIVPTEFLWGSQYAGLAADPLALGAFHRAVTLRELLPMHRFVGVIGARHGHCANVRELLGGVSLRRTDVVIAAAAAMDDVPQASALAELSVREWTTGPVGLAAVPPWRRGLAWLPPVQILNRISDCGTWLETL